jgi:hypothetical protein
MQWKKYLMWAVALVVVLKFRNQILGALSAVPAIGAPTVKFIG